MKTIYHANRVLLIDKAAEIKVGDLIYSNSSLGFGIIASQANFTNNTVWDKIIAASPKMGSLPEFETLPPSAEDDVEKSIRKVIGEEYYKAINKDGSQFNLLKAVYKQAKSESNNSELIDFVKSVRDDWENVSEGYQVRAEKLLQSIAKPKEYEFVVEMEYKDGFGYWYKYTPMIASTIKEPIALRPNIINNKIQGVWAQI